ncbi:MAG: PQQ-binding-like beta-propeller repeat protein [Planctomycetes bacterium]|nr:PQQ-binding-like beta-propeller repeat protein [Planctomycetota bacterium]
MRPPLPLWNLLLLALAGVFSGAPAAAQAPNPVYVDDSPRAWELIQRARQQAAENEGEAIRLYQELLDEYGSKLVPAHAGTDDEYVSVRWRVHRDLLAEETLLARYRLVEEAEGQRLLDAGALRRLTATRALTEPGLEALLRTGQEDLEAARFRAALSRLDEAVAYHDLTPERAAHCWYMIGLAAHYLGRADRHEAALARLGELRADGRACRSALEHLTAAGNGPSVPRGVTSLERAETGDLTELVAQTIWSVPLENTLHARRFGDAGAGPPSSSGFQRRRQGALGTVFATLADSTMYVNEGHTVRALDRFTGRSVWERTYMDRPRLAVIDRDNAQPGDLNVVAVEGDVLVTLTGHAQVTMRSGEGQVISLDARNGQLRWATSLDRIGGDREYEGLFPHGAPIIAEGHVYVMARKVTKQSLTGCYVTALDLGTGALAWIRHIASSGSKAKIARHFSSIVHDDGRLYVASAVGAIAALDATTGDMRWLRRQSVPVTIRDRVRQPWEMSAPLVLGDRILAITPDQRFVVALDRETGAVLETHDARARDGWNSPAYLLASNGMVFGIGSQIRAFTADFLSRPRWRLPKPAVTSEVVAGGAADAAKPEAQPEPPPRFEEELSLVGRVQPVAGALVVPTHAGVLFVDDELGRVLHRLPVERTGNPLAVGSQLAVAGADALEVYMSLERAERMLRKRLAAAPDDPEPALSLVQLGIRVGDLDLALEGAGQAMLAIRRAPDRPGAVSSAAELFSMLLEIHRRRIADSPAQREALYAMIGDVADTPEQEVEYLLAYADGLSGDEPQQAAGVLQSILSKPVLAATVRSESATLRPAAYWAAERLARLRRHHGPDVTAAAERSAIRRFAQLRDGRGSVAELVSLAEEYPSTDAAVDAAALAAERLRDDGSVRAGLAALAAAYHLDPSADRAARLLGRFAELCLADGAVDQAHAVLSSLARRGIDAVETSSGRRDPAVWRDRLAAPTTTPARPALGAQAGPARIDDGRMLLPASPASGSSRRALRLNGTSLTMLAAPDLDEVWTVPIESADARALAIDGEQVLLWQEDQGDPRVTALDSATGKLRWTTTPLRDHLLPALAVDRGVDSQMPNGMPFDPRASLPAVGTEAVFVVRRNGGVVAYERDGTGAVLWSEDAVLDQVHLVLAHDFGLVLAGLGRSASGRGAALEPRIVLLDARTGAVRLRARPIAGVIWMAADPLGSLLCASAEGIELIDLLTGRRRWTSIAYEIRESRRGWIADDHLVVESRTSSQLSVALRDGTVSPPFDTAVRGRWDSESLNQLHVVDDLLVARFRDRVVRYHPSGRVLGADIVTDETREYRALIPARDRLVVVSHHDTRQVEIPDSNQRERQHDYRIYVFTENLALSGEVIDLPPLARRVRTISAVDGWLLLSSAAETLALPMP